MSGVFFFPLVEDVIEADVSVRRKRYIVRIRSGETGSVVLSRLSLLNLRVQAESCAQSRATLLPPNFHSVFHLYSQLPSGESRVNQATQLLRIDGVHRRESAE